MSTLSTSIYYDRPLHVVIGGGSAGCMVCHELAKHGNVILIDIGSRAAECKKVTKQPIRWGEAFVSEGDAIRINSEPLRNMWSKSLLIPIGVGIGGSTNINAMIWTPGSRYVFDNMWPHNWSSFKVERNAFELMSVGTIRSKSVFLSQKSSLENPKKLFSVPSRHNHLLPTESQEEIWDVGKNDESYFATISSEGQRITLGTKILQPLEDSGHVTIISETEVVRVIIECKYSEDSEVRKIATGVCVRDVTGKERIICTRNKGSVVLCAGTFCSPRILSRSGLSNGVVHGSTQQTIPAPYLPALGLNLQDHSVLPYMAVGSWWLPSCAITLKNLPENLRSRVGYEYPLNCVHGWVNLDKNGHLHDIRSGRPPCIQLLFVDGRSLTGILAESVFPRYNNIYIYANLIRPIMIYIVNNLVQFRIINWLLSCLFGVLICNIQPNGNTSKDRNTNNCNDSLDSGGKSSLGKVDVRHNHLLDDGRYSDIRVDLDYSASDEDMKASYNGLQAVRKMLNDSSKSGLWYFEILPGPLFAYCCVFKIFSCFFRIFCGTYFHFCGTCKMVSLSQSPTSSLNDSTINTYLTNHEDDITSSNASYVSDSNLSEDERASGVVDEYLCVIGVDKLRVADSSVIPAIPSGPISATCMAIGLMAGELINKELEDEVYMNVSNILLNDDDDNNSQTPIDDSRNNSTASYLPDEFDDALIDED